MTLFYSGGMKRKLSLAIAFIVSPKIAFLDEPTAGVDAAAKRTLWNKIATRNPGQTVVLTSHSMDEVD